MKKKIVALLLAVTLVAGITINNIGVLEQVEASTSAEEVLELSDFGISEVVSDVEQGFKCSDESLIGKSVKGIYNFNSGGVLAIGNNSWITFVLQAFDDEYGKRLTPYYNDGECGYQYGTAIYASNIGGKDVIGNDLKMEAMFDFVKNEADDKGTLTVTILIDDQYSFVYQWANVGVANLTESIYTRNATVTLKATDYYGTLTPKDFGIDGAEVLNTDTYKPTDTPNASLDGKVIKGIYKLNNGAGLVFGSNSWYGGTVALDVYSDGSNDYMVVYNGGVVGTPSKPNAVNNYIYHYDLGGKKFVGDELEIEAYFNIRENTAGGKDLEVYFTIDQQYKFKYTWENADVTYMKEAMCASYRSTAFTVIEPSAYPNYRLPQSLGATLATDKDVVKMGFSFADVIANEGIAKEDIVSYGAVLAPGTKNAADLKAKAAEMIGTGATTSDIYARTEGDIEKLFATEGNEYYVTITNSGDAENMHIRSTAIAYIKLTDGTIYYTADCNSERTQRVNKSVMGILKAIFAANYVADYDAAVSTGTQDTTPLGQAIVKYNTDNNAAITIDTIKEIIGRANSTVEDRSILRGVHFTLSEVLG